MFMLTVDKENNQELIAGPNKLSIKEADFVQCHPSTLSSATFHTNPIQPTIYQEYYTALHQY
jgi:hypothetical protein